MPPTVCPVVGPPPVTDDDKVLSEYLNSVWVGYLDCFGKLEKIHDTVASWPGQRAEQPAPPHPN